MSEQIDMLKIQKLYDSLNDSEKFGLSFGLFPYEKCKDLTTKESVALMKLEGKNPKRAKING